MTDLPPPPPSESAGSPIPPPPPRTGAEQFVPSAPTSSMRKTGGLGTALFVMMILAAVASGFLLLTTSDRFSYVSDVLDGNTEISITRATEVDDAVETAYGFVAIAGLVIFILLIIYLYRLVANTRNAGGMLRHSNGMAIGGFFIPIANIFIPYRLFTDVVRHMQSRQPENKRAIVIMNWWWWTYFASLLLTQIAAAIDTETLDSLQTSDGVLVVGSLVMMVATIFGAIAIRRITNLSHATFGG